MKRHRLDTPDRLSYASSISSCPLVRRRALQLYRHSREFLSQTLVAILDPTQLVAGRQAGNVDTGDPKADQFAKEGANIPASRFILEARRWGSKRPTIRCAAGSRRAPLGTPRSSRAIFPPCGSGVVLVMPAFSKAREFTTQRRNPSLKAIGCRGVASSKSQRVGNFSSGKEVSEIRPKIH